jgi:hypothetical protein
MRLAVVSKAVRWAVLAYLALVLGWVAPAHHHVVGGQQVASQAAMASPLAALDVDATDPACEVCAWKGQPSLDRGVPAPLLATAPPTRHLAPGAARAPPAAARRQSLPRAPPILVAFA